MKTVFGRFILMLFNVFFITLLLLLQNESMLQIRALRVYTVQPKKTLD